MNMATYRMAIALADEAGRDYHSTSEHNKTYYYARAEELLRKCGFQPGDIINGLTLIPVE